MQINLYKPRKHGILDVSKGLSEEGVYSFMFLILGGGLVIILIAVVIAVVSSVVSAIAADQSDVEN